MANKSDQLFADLPYDSENHFRIYFFLAVLHLIEAAAHSFGSPEEAFQHSPFLIGYNNELARRLSGLSTEEALEQWWTSLDRWEQSAQAPLPLRALREAAALTHAELTLLLLLGVIEEDARFGQLFETLQGTPGVRRPTLAFLRQGVPGLSDSGRAGQLVARMVQLGILAQLNPGAPRHEATFRFPETVWNIMAGGEFSLDCERVVYHSPAEALPLDELVLPEAFWRRLSTLKPLARERSLRTILLRGPRHNGRRTLLKALFASAGLGTVEIRAPGQQADWKEAAALAILLDAALIAELQFQPGEVQTLPTIPVYLPLGIVAGDCGALSGSRIENAVLLELSFPSPAERKILWSRHANEPALWELPRIAAQFRFTSGTICRIAARLEQEFQRQPGEPVGPAEILRAAQALDHRALETLARPLAAGGDLSQLSASDRTIEELQTLARRCRQREALSAALTGNPGGTTNSGVKALLCGPSGCGKSLAARLLGGELNKTVYHIDLSNLVNKFIGETEKNLNRLFTLAEELDVILLLDEGDAVMSRRTDVQNANDRYANLETNYLLQRIESFEGILIVTTNARNRIDPAFERRMDVIIEFGLPSPEERWRIWQTHLPVKTAIDSRYLDEVAAECEFTGGQIRNAVHHATLLALDDGGVVTTAYCDAAVRREYRKKGLTCPLRPQFAEILP